MNYRLIFNQGMSAKNRERLGYTSGAQPSEERDRESKSKPEQSLGDAVIGILSGVKGGVGEKKDENEAVPMTSRSSFRRSFAASVHAAIFTALILLCGCSSSVAAKKCLIVNIDNRPLTENINDHSYASMSSVINLAYAKRHNYDFVYLQTVVDDLVSGAHAKYGEFEDNIPPTSVAKDLATAFHVGLKQFRAASWAKLPPLWHITTEFGDKYEYILYIDSDAVMSPLHINRSIEEALQDWEDHSMIERGSSTPTKSAFTFLNNRPWRDDMPCAGSFIYRPALAEPMLREWWDFDLPTKNFNHFHEQDALWHMITAENDPEWIKSGGPKFRMNSSSYTISQEQQFPSAWKRYEELWLCHIASYNHKIRNPILFHFLKILELDSEQSYAAAIQEIKAKHILLLKLLDISGKMEDASQRDQAARVTRWPKHEEATQSGFYDAHVTTKQLSPLSLSVLHEGHLLCQRGQFWVVLNGTRHGFENFDHFLSIGFHAALGFPLSTAEAASIPLGPSIPLKGGEKEEFMEQLPLWNLRDPYRPRSSGGGSPFISSGGSSSEVADGCTRDLELEKLVSVEGTRAVLYLISHDDASEAMTKSFAACKGDWIKVVRLNGTKFFESSMYRDILPQRRAEWADRSKVDYVITATYKTVSKQLHYNKFTQDLAMIKELLKAARDGDWDIIPFLRSGSGNMSFSSYHHGKGFRQCWDAILKAIGFSNDSIRALDEHKPFYRNIFIIRPAALEMLVDRMCAAMSIAVNDPIVAELLQQDSKYKEGSVEVAQRMFGTSHYQMHPFIFERLPSFFLQVNGSKICHYPHDGPCKYNT